MYLWVCACAWGRDWEEKERERETKNVEKSSDVFGINEFMLKWSIQIQTEII